MEKNKVISKLCCLETTFYIVFLTILILHYKKGLGNRTFALLIFLSFLGCAVSLALRDYLKSLLRNADFDVAGIHDKKSLEKELLKLQNADDTLNIGVMMFDLNNLKKINDVYGHMAGDRALRNLGTLLSRYTANGIACRLGGDEFLLFLPDISAENVSKLTTRLFHHFHSIAEADPEIKDAALSAGLYMCTTSDTFADCYSKADKALYNVKQNGKNHFSFYHQISHSSSDSPGTARDLQQVADALRKSGSYAGALELNYRDFSRQYEYMQQLIIRSGSRCYLVMLTLEATSDTPAHIEEIEQTLSHMEQAIQNTIRRVDICTRYSSMQYLIILFEPIETEIPHIMDRIFMQYRQQCDNTNFRPTYEYLAIAGEKQ